jgi:geranylgeranyl diphosphate synthase type I
MTGPATLQEFAADWLPALEVEMRTVLACSEPALATHYGMMHYHMGWAGADFQPQNLPAGKRLRPLLCLLACRAVGGTPAQALPAAAGIEILHNFSLVHDDIEDGDELRRHRPTAWKLWGVAQAINMGDGMYTLAFAAVQRLTTAGVAPATTLAALHRFTGACVALTEGQHLDISFEQRDCVTVEEYLRMIQGKTAALVGASVAIGALIGGASPAQGEAIQQFGQAIGLAFQIQDDLLGIWGDPAVTGKAAGNDILRKKKSLPLLYALNHPQVGPRLAALLDGGITAAQLPQALALLDEAGTRAYTEEQARVWHRHGLTALRVALGDRAGTSLLHALTEQLLNRQA